MKKMVCEICESQKIKKDNGVFVCQDCGTEYSLDEAKKLLVEIDENVCSELENNSTKISIKEENNLLKEKLLLWANVMRNIDSARFFIDAPVGTDHQLWNKESCEPLLKSKSKGKFYNLSQEPSVHSIDWDTYFDLNGKENVFWWMNNTVNVYAGRTSYLLNLNIGMEHWRNSLEMEQKQLNKPNFMYDPRREEVVTWVKKYEKAIQFCETIENDVDYIISGSYLHGFFNNLIDEKFCFEEAGELFIGKFPKYKNPYGYLVNPSGCVTDFDISKNYEDDYMKICLYYGFLYKCLNESKPYYFRYEWHKKGILFRYDVYDEFKVYYKTNVNFESLKNKINDKFKEYEDNYNRFYSQQIIPLIEESKKVILSSIDVAKTLESEFNLPLKYRNTDILLKMIELIESGNATTWKEVANLYDTHKHREEVKLSLDMINQKLNNISYGLFNIGNELFKINNNLNAISSKISSLNEMSYYLLKNTESIKKHTFSVMWNTI